MHKLLLSASVAAGVALTTSAVRAFPASQIGSPAGDVVQVRDLCGPGWHRGLYGECRPNGTGYAYGPYALYEPPREVRCWWEPKINGVRRVCTW